jgi:hypothetical protein
LLIANHHTYTRIIVTVVTADLSSKSRDLDHLLPSAAVQWLSDNDSSMDNHSVHADLFLNCCSSAAGIGDRYSE